MRRKRVVESFGSAAKAIGPIAHGMSVFAITRGQFSMIDMILYCLSQIGTASVSVWTWAIADYETEAMAGLMARREIDFGRLVIDSSADRRNGEIIEQWRRRFGDDQVKVCRNHAKIARVWNDDFRLLLRGSMNLNFNPRFEQLDITEGGDDFGMVERIESELAVLPRKYSNADVESATKINRAFEYSTLRMFAGVRPWRTNDADRDSAGAAPAGHAEGPGSAIRGRLPGVPGSYRKHRRTRDHRPASPHGEPN